MLTEIFGDVLYTPGSEILQEFPSAELVKGRIIISTKPPKEYLEAQEIKEKETNQTKAEDLTDAEASGKEVLELKGSHADLGKVCVLLLQKFILLISNQWKSQTAILQLIQKFKLVR